MNDVYIVAETFLNSVFTGSGLELQARSVETADGCKFNIDGADAGLLLADGGDFLEALQHLINQIYGRTNDGGGRFICDAQNFRATREAELLAMARHAAEQVRKTGSPFAFGPMNSGERRVIHLALAEEPELLTESVGDGSARRLKVSMKD
jgi:spoIIIJ-associated protein